MHSQSPRSNVIAQCRIRAIYLARHGRLPNLVSPKTFTELVQYRKLYDRDPRMPRLADKVAVKDYVAAKIGRDWVIPTLWSGVMLPDINDWPLPFVMKSRHGWNQVAFLTSDPIDWPHLRRLTERWMKTAHGGWLDEWIYADIERGLLVEPYIGRGALLPIDYKFYVFGGRVAFIQVHLERATNHRWMLFDRNWKRVSTQTDDQPGPPTALQKMIEAAETLAANFDFVRVDLYQPGDQPRFGEMTFYPGSGFDPFDPVGLDTVIGAHWLAAVSARADRAPDVVTLA